MTLLVKLNSLPARMHGPPRAVCARLAACALDAEGGEDQLERPAEALKAAMRPALGVFGRALLILAACALVALLPLGVARALGWDPTFLALCGALTALGGFVYSHDRAGLFVALGDALGAPVACARRALGPEPRADRAARLRLAHVLAHVAPAGAFERCALVQDAAAVGVVLTRPGLQLAVAVARRGDAPTLVWDARTDDPQQRDAWRGRGVAPSERGDDDGLCLSGEAAAPRGDRAALDAVTARLAHVATPPGGGEGAREAWTHDLARLRAPDAPMALLPRALHAPPLAPSPAPLRRQAWGRFVFFWATQACVAMTLGLGLMLALTLALTLGLPWVSDPREALRAYPVFAALIGVYGLTLAAAYCAALARQTPRLPCRVARWRAPERAASVALEVSAERLRVGDDALDLSRPFTLRLSRDPAAHDDACLITLDLRQPAAQADAAPQALAFAVALPAHARLMALPALITSAPCLPSAPFMARVWPALRDACELHGVAACAPLTHALRST